MKYTEEIFNILSKGGFISSNSVSPAMKRYYDAIEEELAEYYEYYKGIGFYLEGGDGYYLFTRREAKKAAKLFSDKKKYNEVVEKLVAELEKSGMIELENEHDSTYKVLTAFHYMENLGDCITISEELNDEVSQ